MARYAIGDIQGCYHAFQSLLQAIEFRPGQDTLWLVGDVINRGAGSLDVLRWLVKHDKDVITVLGNHDLHALVVYEGFARMHRSDTLTEIFEATDADTILGWLRQQRLAYSDGHYLMVHAGVLPSWSVEETLHYAGEVEMALRAPNYRDLLKAMYGNQPDQWQEDLTGVDRLRVITNALTRMRVIDDAGRMEFVYKRGLESIPDGWQPWFTHPQRVTQTTPVLFGHWSSLGLCQTHNVIGLDTGCLWGGQLTAYCLDDGRLVQVDSHPDDKPLQIGEA